MKQTQNKELKVITKGAPNLSNLSKSEKNSFLACLELQIREFYTEKQKSKRKQWILTK